MHILVLLCVLSPIAQPSCRSKPASEPATRTEVGQEQIIPKVREIVAKKLEVDANTIAVDAPLSKQRVPADELDAVEIILDVEAASLFREWNWLKSAPRGFKETYEHTLDWEAIGRATVTAYVAMAFFLAMNGKVAAAKKGEPSPPKIGLTEKISKYIERTLRSYDSGAIVMAPMRSVQSGHPAHSVGPYGADSWAILGTQWGHLDGLQTVSKEQIKYKTFRSEHMALSQE